MENALRQAKSRKSIEGNQGQADQANKIYSPLIVNGVENSNNDNAHILGSEKTGATPNPPNIARQISIGGAIISEFNPLGEEQQKAALDNPQITKGPGDQNAVQQVLVDNFLKSQNLNLAPSQKLLSSAEIKSLPHSPGAKWGLKSRPSQKQITNNKNRRLTNSVSTTTIPELKKLTGNM